MKYSHFVLKRYLCLILILPLINSCVLQARQTNTAPTVRITSPEEADIFLNSSLRINLEAEDAENNLSSVQLFENGQLLGEANQTSLEQQSQESTSTARWYFDWTAPQNGSYTVSAEATDAFGLKSMATVSFEVEVPNPDGPTTPPVDDAAYQDFLNNQTLWQDNNFENYVVDFQRICFCLPDFTQAATLTVENQNLTDATYLNGGAVSRDIYDNFLTVDKAFELIQEAFNRDSDEVRIVYDSIYGFPINVFIDYDKRMADEELVFKFSNFMP